MSKIDKYETPIGKEITIEIIGDISKWCRNNKEHMELGLLDADNNEMEKVGTVLVVGYVPLIKKLQQILEKV